MGGTDTAKTPGSPSCRGASLAQQRAGIHLLLVLLLPPGEACWLQSHPAAVVEGVAVVGVAGAVVPAAVASAPCAESWVGVSSRSCPSVMLVWPVELPGSGVLGACSVGVAACMIFCRTSRILSCKQTLVGNMSE